MIRLLVVRHGETEWNQERRLQGRQDIGLGEVGRAQATALAPTIAREAPGYVATSALRRTHETADALGVRVDRHDARLDEASLGNWEGEFSADIREADEAAYRAWRAGDHRPPGGEGFEELTARVVAGIADAVLAATGAAGGSGAGTVCQAEPRPLLVITHGGPARAFLQAVVGLAPARTVPSHPASLSVYDVDDAALRRSDHPAGVLTVPGVVRLRMYNFAPAAQELDPSD